MTKQQRWPIGLSLFVLVLILFPLTVEAQSGHVLNGVGASNQSMGGVGTANPIDAIGALHWNPASIQGLSSSEISIGFESFHPRSRVSSTIQPNSFGPGFPSRTSSGSTSSEFGSSPIPTLGLVIKPNDSLWAFGLGVAGVGGFGVDYPARGSNPITTPQPPRGLGFGAIESNYQLLQISPTVAYQLSESLSIGFSPTLNYATLRFTPAPIVPPNDANGDGFPTFPTRAGTATSFGIGAQVGIYYDNGDGLRLGASIKSPQYFEPFSFNSEDEAGGALGFRYELNYPMIVSLGMSYYGIKNLTVGVDARFIDYENTRGFESARFRSSGSVKGFGWKSIFVIALGVQYKLTENFIVRSGYSFNDRAVRNGDTFINSPAPAIIQHQVYGGFTIVFDDRYQLNIAARHGLENSIRGNFKSAVGVAPGATVRSELSTFSVSFSFSVKFGAGSR